MTKKILLGLFLFVFVLGGSFGFFGIASAQTFPNFPVGCTSALGYSVTNGSPCNGTSSATLNIPGCTTALGYSITTGVACSGTNIAIPYLAGCTSTYGYSTISPVPCNGTATVTQAPGTGGTPGLPTTGAGGDAIFNILLLVASAITAFVGYKYFIRKYSVS